MAAKIGILGESTVVTESTTTTMYTVPADKAARVRILMAMVGDSAGAQKSINISIGAPGTEFVIGATTTATANQDIWHGAKSTLGEDSVLIQAHPASTVGDGGEGILFDTSAEMNFGTTFIAGTGMWITPMPREYDLSTGDTVKVKNAEGTAWGDVMVQVMGVEDDA